jgi:serine/threonine protein kinase
VVKNFFEKEFVSDLGESDTIGRYKILRKLGQGGTGVVYLARDPYIKRNVAIKISQVVSDKGRERFFIEAQSAGRLSHQNIVAIHDVGIFKDFCYITMEYIEGPTLDKFCRKTNLLPVNKVTEIIFSVCNALDYAHKQGVIHRDIKPANIMLDNSGNAKITDFGVAQMTEKTAEMGIFGTPSYMSPEQLRDEIAGNESDLFSIGCVLYELLSGEQAFPGENSFSIMYKITNEEPVSVLSIRPDLPEIFGEITKKALAKDPDKRYPSGMAFGFDLRVALRGLVGDSADEKVGDFTDDIYRLGFFSEFTSDQLREIVSASNIVNIPEGQVVVAEGEIDDTFYILMSGKAKVRKNGKDIASIGTGECFGEMACIGGQARVATVVADTDCIVMKISATLLDGASDSVKFLFFKNFAMTLVRRLSKNPQEGP